MIASTAKSARESYDATVSSLRVSLRRRLSSSSSAGCQESRFAALWPRCAVISIAVVAVLSCNCMWVARAANSGSTVDFEALSKVDVAGSHAEPRENGDGGKRILSPLEAFIEGLCEGSSDHCYLEKVEFEAIKALHRQLDDDADGDVDVAESTDFLREELQYEGGSSATRQQAFHQKDEHISVDDLWRSWIHSEVHNWTAEETGEWVLENVGLPQYVDTFLTYQINGSLLPTLATNSRFMTDVLNIRDPIHRQKISLKAMDVVLFGAPKAERHHIWKESVLLVLLVVTLGCYWYAYQENKRSQKQLKRMMQDMEGLSKAEKALANMQKELCRTKEEDEQAERKKRSDLEKKIRLEISEKCDLGGGTDNCLEEQVARLKEELTVVRTELDRAEQELTDRCWFAPPELQRWLQLTFEIELKYFNAKKAGAQSQLAQAKEACDKLKKRRSNLIGSFVSAHGKSIDEVDSTILQAKSALVEVTNDLAERMQRWQEIERLCNCSIINNPGYTHLTSLLRGGTQFSSSSYPSSLTSRMNGSHHGGDDDDDAASVYAPSVVEKLVWSSMPMFIHPVHGSTGGGISSVGPTTTIIGNGVAFGGGGAARLYRRKKSLQATAEGTVVANGCNGALHPSNTQVGFDVICTPHARAAVAIPNGGDVFLHQVQHSPAFPHSKSTIALGSSVTPLPRKSPSSTVLDQMNLSETEAIDEYLAGLTDDEQQSRRSSRKVVGVVDDEASPFGGNGGVITFSPRPISAAGLTRRVRMSNKSLSHDAAGMDPIISGMAGGAVASAIHGREALLQQSPSKSHSESALDSRIRGAAVAAAASAMGSTPPLPTGSPSTSRRFPVATAVGVGPSPRSQAAGDGNEVIPPATPPSLGTSQSGDGEAKSASPNGMNDDAQQGLDPKSSARRSKKSLFSKLTTGRHRKTSPPSSATKP